MSTEFWQANRHLTTEGTIVTASSAPGTKEVSNNHAILAHEVKNSLKPDGWSEWIFTWRRLDTVGWINWLFLIIYVACVISILL